MITGGSLRQYLKKMGNPKLKVIKKWCVEILQGLNYLHTQNIPIIHRDIKCDNIFVNSNSGEIKIGDLGLSTTMKDSYTSSVLGTPEFMAPELYEEHYGTEVDIYAFGMAVLEMLTQEAPYRECQNPAQIYRKVVNRDFPKSLERINDPQVYKFITWCLAERKNRPTAEQLLLSEFMNDKTSANNEKPVSLFETQKIPPKFQHFKHRDLNGSLEGIPEQEEPCSQIMTGKIQIQEFQQSAANDYVTESHQQPQNIRNQSIQENNHIQISQNNNEEQQNEINIAHDQIKILQQNFVIENEKEVDKNEDAQINNHQFLEQSKNIIQEKNIQQNQNQNPEKNNQAQENLNQHNQSIDHQSQNEKSTSKNPQDTQTDQSMQNGIFQKKENIIVESNDKSPRFFNIEKPDSIDSLSASQNGQKNEQTFQQPKTGKSFLKDINLDIQNQLSFQNNIEEGLSLEKKQQQQVTKSKSEFIQKQKIQEQHQNSPDRLSQKKISQNIFQYGSPQKRKVEKQIHQSLHENMKAQPNQEEQNKVKSIFQQLQEENKNDKHFIAQVQSQQQLGDQAKAERKKFKEDTQNFVIQNKTNASQQTENQLNQNQSVQNSIQQLAQKVKEDSENQLNQILTSVCHQVENQQSQNLNNQTSYSTQVNKIKDEAFKNQNQVQINNSHLSESQSNQSPPLENHFTQQIPIQQKPSQNIQSQQLDISLQSLQQSNEFEQPQDKHMPQNLKDKSIKKNEENLKRHDLSISHYEKEKIQVYPYKKEFKEDQDDKNYQARSQIVDLLKIKQNNKNSSFSRQEGFVEVNNKNLNQSNLKQEIRQELHKLNTQPHNSNQKQNSELLNHNKKQRSRSVSASSNTQRDLKINQLQKQIDNQQSEQLVRSISEIENKQEQMTDKSEVESSITRDLGGLIQQLNQSENKNDMLQNQKNLDKLQQSTNFTKNQIQQNIQNTSSVKQNQRKIKIEATDRNEFKKKMQTALKPKNDTKKAEFENQQSIQIGRLKEIGARQNIRNQPGTFNNYGSRKEQTRSVPPQKSPKNNQNSIQEPNTTKMNAKKQIDNNASTSKQKGANINLGNQTNVINEIPKIENLEILAMTINFGDNVVTFEFCLGRDTPEQVANDFAAQMNLDSKHQNQFCKEIHENLKKHQLEKKKSAQQRGRNGSGQTAKEKQIDHSNSFFNTQYPQIFSDYQQNNIIPIKNDIQKTQSFFPKERGERTNEKLNDNGKINEKLILQQNEDHLIHKSMRQSMLEMNNNNNLCETKEVIKPSNDNESLQRKKKNLKEEVFKVIVKKVNNYNSSANSMQQSDQQTKNGKEIIKKIISPDNIQFKDVKQYKVTNSKNQNQQQSTQQMSPTNNAQSKNQEVSINIQQVKNSQNNSQVKKTIQDQSPQIDQRTIAYQALQKQQKLQNMFKNMKNSIKDFFEEVNLQDISDVSQIIGKSERFQSLQLQNEFIQSLREINLKYLKDQQQKEQLKEQAKELNTTQYQTINSKIIQTANLQQVGKSLQTQNNLQAQKIRSNKESFNSIQPQFMHPPNTKALHDQAISLIKRVKAAVKEGFDQEKMENILKDKILPKKQESQNDQTYEITDNSSIKASAGSSQSSIMTASLRLSIHAENMRNLLPLLDEDNENSEDKTISDIKILQGRLELPQDGIITQELNQKIEQYLERINFKNKNIADQLKKTKIQTNFKQKPINQQPNNQQNGGDKQQVQNQVQQIENKVKRQGQIGSQSLTRQKSFQPGGQTSHNILISEQNKKN